MLDVSFFLLGLNVNSVLVDDPGGLPAGAIAFADFRNGTYHYGGNALSDFLAENTDWGTFDPTAILPHIGLYGDITAAKSPVLGSALTAVALADGFTAMVTFLKGRMIVGAADLPDFNQFVEATAHLSGSPTELFAVDTHYPYNTFAASDAMHRLAFTYQSGHAAMCIDGGEVVTADYATLNAVNAVCFDGAYSWADLTLYPAKADGALVALTAFDASAIPAIDTPYTLPATANVGDTLTMAGGTFTNSPTLITFAWSSNATGTYLGSGATYVSQVGDAGNTLTCDAFAENASGYVHFAASVNIAA